MAYDQELAGRIRALLSGQGDVSEKKMFGGLAFLVNGNMAISASAQGGVLVRVDPSRSGELTASGHAEVMEMRGQPMPGWLRVAPEHVSTQAQLSKWAAIGTGFARSLPPKH